MLTAFRPDAPDPRRLLHRPHEAVRTGGHVQFVDAVDAKAAKAEFMVLREGRIHFQGTGAELLASSDSYLLEEFLFRTLRPC